MIAHWPTDLDLPLRDGWEASPLDGRIPRAADAGPLGYKRRYSAASRLVSLELDLSRDQKAVFDNFRARDLKSASLPFTMADPSSDGWALWVQTGAQLLAEDSTPILISARWLCLFTPDPPTETMTGLRFRVGFTIAVLP